MKIRWQDIPGYVGLGFVILFGAVVVVTACSAAGLFILTVNGALYPWERYRRWKADKNAKADSFRRVLACLDAQEVAPMQRALGLSPVRQHQSLNVELQVEIEVAKSFPHRYGGVEAVVLPIRPKAAN